MRALTIGVVLALMAVGGWFGFSRYQAGEETAAAISIIQGASSQTERQLKARQEDGITFAEYFKRVSATVENLDKLIADLDSKTWAYKPEDRDIAVAFIEQCKVVIRADQASTRLMMEESNARDSRDSAKKELDEADSTVSINWALKRFKRASDELISVLQKQIENAEQDKEKIEKMVSADDAVKAAFGKDKGLSPSTADSMRKSITPAEANTEKASNG